MSKFDYPLLLDPIAVPRPWGGGRLCKLYDRECVSSDQPIGESWDVSTWPKDPGNENLATVTPITNGPLAGKMLDEVVSVPVVVKLLDSAEKLSVQIHPVTKDVHKDEMWYILWADEESYLFLGLADGVKREDFCALIKQGKPPQDEVLAMLNCVKNPKPGMFYNVPTGTVHAVGPGLVAFEVSETTQVTYRLFDYGRPRQIHIEDGCTAVMANREDLKVLNSGMKYTAADKVELLTEFPTFTVEKITGANITVTSADHIHLITATHGDCKITGPTDDWSITLKHSATCLAPKTDKAYTIDTCGSGEVLIAALRD